MRYVERVVEVLHPQIDVVDLAPVCVCERQDKRRRTASTAYRRLGGMLLPREASAKAPVVTHKTTHATCMGTRSTATALSTGWIRTRVWVVDVPNESA